MSSQNKILSKVDPVKRNKYTVMSLIFGLLPIVLPLIAIVGIFLLEIIDGPSPEPWNGLALVGFTLLFFIFWLPVGFLGLIMGYLGLKSQKKKTAVFGLVLNSIVVFLLVFVLVLSIPDLVFLFE